MMSTITLQVGPVYLRKFLAFLSLLHVFCNAKPKLEENISLCKLVRSWGGTGNFPGLVWTVCRLSIRYLQ